MIIHLDISRFPVFRLDQKKKIQTGFTLLSKKISLLCKWVWLLENVISMKNSRQMNGHFYLYIWTHGRMICGEDHKNRKRDMRRGLVMVVKQWVCIYRLRKLKEWVVKICESYEHLKDHMDMSCNKLSRTRIFIETFMCFGRHIGIASPRKHATKGS